jgi:hypothetical protein
MKKMFTTKPGWVMLILAFCLFGLQSFADTEPNDNIASANSLALNTIQNGDLFVNPANDADDYYELTLPANGSVMVSGNFSAGLTGRFYFYNSNGTQVGLSSTGSGDIELSLNCLGEGTFYVRASRNSGSGSYTFTVTLTEPAFATDIEPNGGSATSSSIDAIQETFEENEEWEGQLGFANPSVDTDDWYYLLSPRDGNVSISAFFEGSLTGWVYLYSKNGAVLATSSAGTGLREATANCFAQDTIVARVRHNSGCGSYSASFTTSTLENEIDIEPNGDDNIVLSISTIQETFEESEEFTGHIGYIDADLGLDKNDWFYLISPRDGNVTITASFDSSLTGWVYLYEKDGTQLSISPPGTGLRQTTANCFAQDTIVGRVRHNSGCGSYSAFFTTSTLDNEIDVEPNGDDAIVASISTIQETFEEGEEFTGHIGYIDADLGLDKNDWFYLISPRDGNVTISASFDSSLTGWVYLYEKDGTQLSISAAGTGLRQTTTNCFAQDTIVARIRHNSGCGSYVATFSTSVLPHQADQEPNGNGNISASLPLAIESENSKINQGHLGYIDADLGTDTDDWYEISVSEVPFELEAKLAKSNDFSGFLYLYSSTGSQLQIINHSGQIETELTATITNAGTYYLRIRQTAGCGSYTLGNFCANAPEVAINFDGDLNLCPGESLLLSATGGLEGYSWLKDGEVVGTDPTYLATEAGTYNVVGFDVNGCDGLSEEVVINVFNVPEVSITAVGPTDLCLGESVVLSAAEGFNSYLWSNGETTQSVEVDLAGSYSATATTEDGCDASSANSIDVTLQPDSDNDGICDADDSCPDFSGEVGDACDDGDPTTINDAISEDCECEGTPTIAPLSVSLSFNSNCAPRDVSVKLYETGTTNLLHSYNSTVGASGDFNLPVALGTFDIFVKVEGYLQVGAGNVLISSPSGNSIAFGSLDGGDINNDNVINILDISAVNASFGSSVGDNNYSELADFNCDGNVNILDVSGLNANFGSSGMAAPISTL